MTPMEQKVVIRCKNNKKILNCNIGSTLSEIFSQTGLQMEYGPINARVNNKVEGMHYRVYNPKEVEFLDMYNSSAHRAYTRSLFFVLNKAAHEVIPHCSVHIDIPVSKGYYVNLIKPKDSPDEKLTLAEVDAIRHRMEEIIAADMPIHRHEVETAEAIKMFRESESWSKVKLMEGLGQLYTTFYDIDGYKDYYYGSMLTSTKQIYLFGLEPYFDGLLLRIPKADDPSQLGEMVRQDKMFEIFKEHHRWQNILGVRTVGDINAAISKGYSSQMIQVSEALQEKKIAHIADEIAARKNVKMVLIAGPSSSGKTTTCKRLSVQLAVNGIKPVGISLDDYFVSRDKTPRDASGDYDFEHLHALDIPLLNQQMNALLPELTAQIPEEQKYRVYASALTTILLDNHNYIPTTDNRLLRRIIRDYKYRGMSAQETIRRWPSVRRGEDKWIFPYQENADAMFNTAMMFELAVIRGQAIPALEQVPENCEEYAEAYRLLKFLRYIKPIPEDQIPPTSLLREFLGGSSFEY